MRAYRSWRLAAWASLAVIGAAWLSPSPLAAQDEFDDEFGDEFGDEFAEEEPAPAQEGGASAEFEGSADLDAFDEFGAEASGEAAATGEATPPPPAATSEEERRGQLFRAHNTFLGPVGGIRVVDAGSAEPGTFRLQLATEFFFDSDFLESGDDNDSIGGALSVSFTPLDFLEIFASIQSSANANNMEEPELFQVLGDMLLGVKGYIAVIPWLTLGGDLSLALLNKTGDIGVVLSGTSFGIRANATADLRQLPSSFPLIARVNLQYYFDNSSNLVEDIENERYGNLPDRVDPREDETRHLVTRVERFALDINRTDFFNFGVGFEMPLRVAEDFYLHPILEWTLGVPVNRQDYNCLFVPAEGSEDEPAEGEDGCLDREGFASFPQNLTIGLRVLPPVKGLSVLAGVEIGLTGTSDFVRELSANRPYNVMLGLSYAYDPSPPVPEPVVREVEKRVEVRAPAPVRGRIRGMVVEQGANTPVAGAVVRFAGRDLTPLYTTDNGGFVSYALEPGEVPMEITHPDYNPGSCAATIPSERPAAPGEDAAVAASPEEPGAPAEPEAGTAAGEDLLYVDVRCELTALPRVGSVRGRVSGADGAAVAASITLEGPTPRTISADAAGQFNVQELAPGEYTARAEADKYLIKLETFRVEPRETAEVQIQLVPKPARPLVQVRNKDIQIRRQINFATDSAEILPSSDPLMTEIADVMIRNPQLTRIEIQGHTDNTGTAERNLQLSQQRADAVRQWLVEHGVEASRLEGKGYGQSQPLFPNITPANRARNRRVQFKIVEQSEAPASE